jgi:hypothetical protein
MTRHYTVEQEERVRALANVGDWARAGIIAAEQAERLEANLQPGLRRTNVFLRAVLALFTALIIAASTALVFIVFSITRELATALTYALGAIVCIGGAEYLIRAFRLYRHGIEESLVAAAVVLVSLSTAELLRAAGVRHPEVFSAAAASAGAAIVYRRYGFVYAAIAAMVCAAAIPFSIDLPPHAYYAFGAAVCAATIAIARRARPPHSGDFPGDDYELLQAAAFAGMYLFLNVRLFDVIGPAGARTVVTWFYWTTYVCTWLIPGIGLLLAIREKDRPLLTVSLVLAFATLATNKPYLGMARESWDPILFGGLLVVSATAVRRWLARGPGAQRGAFTAEKILERDRDWLRTLATASVAMPHDLRAARPPEAAPSQFEGGRSGGGGGGAQY